jgi:hypothetical protein
MGGNMKRYQKTPLIPVSVGDVIEVCFNHEDHSKKYQAKVLKVTKRFGRYNDGKDPTSPLLKVHWINEPKQNHPTFDQRFVTRVIERSKVCALPYNMYREICQGGNGSIRVTKATWEGNLEELVMFALSKLPPSIAIEQPIDELKITWLFINNPLGLIKNNLFYCTVNRKRFMNWVKKNYRRLLKTTKEMDREQTAMNRMCEKINKEDCRAEQDDWQDSSYY